jgi:hypothetical protein
VTVLAVEMWHDCYLFEVLVDNEQPVSLFNLGRMCFGLSDTSVGAYMHSILRRSHLDAVYSVITRPLSLQILQMHHQFMTAHPKDQYCAGRRNWVEKIYGMGYRTGCAHH